MAIPLRTLADARDLLTRAVAEFKVDGEDTSTLEALNLAEANLADLVNRLDTIEARLKATYNQKWDAVWSAAQDDVWAKIQESVPNFDRLMDDPRTKAILKRVMRVLSARRCQRMAG